MLEAVLSSPVPPAVQPGTGGDQQARHLHVLLLEPLQEAGGRGRGQAVRGLRLEGGERQQLLQCGHLLLWEQTPQRLHTGPRQPRTVFLSLLRLRGGVQVRDGRQWDLLQYCPARTAG